LEEPYRNWERWPKVGAEGRLYLNRYYGIVRPTRWTPPKEWQIRQVAAAFNAVDKSYTPCYLEAKAGFLPENISREQCAMVVKDIIITPYSFFTFFDYQLAKVYMTENYHLPIEALRPWMRQDGKCELYDHSLTLREIGYLFWEEINGWSLSAWKSPGINLLNPDERSQCDERLPTSLDIEFERDVCNPGGHYNNTGVSQIYHRSKARRRLAWRVACDNLYYLRSGERRMRSGYLPPSTGGYDAR